MTIFFFIATNFILFLIGRGIVISFNLKSQDFYFLENKKFINLEFKYFYTIITLFLIGNFNVFLNFFIPINRNFVLIFLFLFLSLNLKYKPTNIFNLKSFHYFALIPFILSISSYSINLAHDAGLYHLNTQNWIRSEKIVFGLSNLHSRYGYSSIFDYISSSFWLNNNFIFLHFINLIFINLFFYFLLSNLLERKNSTYKDGSFLVIIFGVLDNFGLGGGRNGFLDIEAVTKFDTVFAIMYFFTALGLIELVKTNLENKEYFLFLTTFLIFTVQLRIFGYTLLFLYAIYLFRFRSNIINYIYSPLIRFLSISYFSWLAKNFMLTSCLIFPQTFTCLNLFSWSNKSAAILELDDLKKFHINYSLGENFFIWFEKWILKPINYSVLVNFLISFFVIFFLNKFLFNKKTQNKDFDYLPFFFVFFSLIVWVLTSPGVRFILGLLIFSIFMLSNNYEEFDFRLKFIRKYSQILLLIPFIFSLIFLLRLDYYSNFLNNYKEEILLSPPNVEYENNSLGWGLVTSDGSANCWIQLECLPKAKKINLIEKNSYKFIVLKN